MKEAVHENFPSSSPTAGNELQVRTWLGDVQSVPAYQVRSALLSFCHLHLLPCLLSHHLYQVLVTLQLIMQTG